MYIAIEGAIGVGKTTLSRLLSSRFQADLMLEVFEENPFLADFYEDRDAYAFQTQIFFLLSRYHQQQEVPPALESGSNLIADYTFEKDALFARLNLGGDELDTYFSVHNALAEKLPLPDLIVYLQAETSILMQRIAHRDRVYERNMDRGYIESLNDAYDAFYSGEHSVVPVLRINTNQLNYVANEGDLDWVENRIRQTLKVGPYQTQFFQKS
jgi:deoxyguanosine kinase